MKMLEASPNEEKRHSLGKTLALVGYGLVFAWWTFAGIAIFFGWPEPSATHITFDHWEKFLDWGNGVLLAGFLLYAAKTIEGVKKDGK